MRNKGSGGETITVKKSFPPKQKRRNHPGDKPEPFKELREALDRFLEERGIKPHPEERTRVEG